MITFVRGFYFWVSEIYARNRPRRWQKNVEWAFFSMAVFSLCFLVYAHVYYSQSTNNCLDHVKDVWPRDGILRVEIIYPHQRRMAEQMGTLNELFTLEKSYERQYGANLSKLKRRGTIYVNITEKTKTRNRQTAEKAKTCNPANIEELFYITPKESYCVKMESSISQTEYAAQVHSTKYPSSSDEVRFQEDPTIEENKEIYRPKYIVELSMYPDLLGMHPKERSEYGIPVMFVALEPTRAKCYNDTIGQFFMRFMIDHDKLLMASVKSLVEKEQKPGYLINVVTNLVMNYDRIFKPMSSYIVALLIMVFITACTSCSYRNIFLCVTRITQNQNQYHFFFYFVVRQFMISIPAQVGMVLLTDEFIYPASSYCYIPIIIVADVYFMCHHNRITKKHWPKFFYLYFFTFFAYHVRFNGQFKYLVLTCLWLFMQHSMIYFYHHYELPCILRLYRMLQIYLNGYVRRQTSRSPTIDDRRSTSSDSDITPEELRELIF